MHTITVATWNVLADAYLRPQYYPHLTELPDPSIRLQQRVQCAAELARRCDVLVAQEAEQGFVDTLRGELGDTHKLRYARRGSNRADGSLVVVRTELGGDTFVGHCGAGDGAWAGADIQVGQRWITVVGTHLAWAEEGSENHPGVTQVHAIGTALTGAAVLAGDLNSDLGGDITCALGADGWRLGPRAGRTAHVNGGDAHIDWVCVRGPGIAITSSTVADPDPDGNSPLPNGTFGSDHLPVIATIHVTN